MADIIYKTLFEVQLLHEYYLTNSDGTTVFDKHVNKTNFLLNSFGKDSVSISNNLLYEVPLSMQGFFKNYQLHVIPRYAGFAVMARVTQQKLPDGTIVYKPLVKLPDDCNVLVQLSLKNNLLNAVTNNRINKAIPAAYYFTNEDVLTGRTFPVLSADIPPFDPAYLYEQGELYVNTRNKVCFFYINKNTPDFIPVDGNGYVNTRDQLIVPLQFTYRFDPADSATQAKFELKDQSGNTVRSYEYKNDTPLQRITINFRNDQSAKLVPPEDAIKTLPLSMPSAEIIYTLTVTLNETSTRLHNLIFFEGDDSLSPCWAIVNIRPMVGNPDFSLYDADELIKYRRLPDGTSVAAPVFEVRVKSRVTFWRYINDKSGKLKIAGNTAFLDKAGNNLVSKKPRSCAYLPTLYKDSGNALHYLPNPESDEQVTIEGRKLYSDILVPESKMFPLDTS